MKKTLLTFAILLLTGMSLWAQAPKGFNYQGVARSLTGTPLSNQAINLRLTMHDGIATGSVAYQESFNVTTNSFGLYNVVVGTGTILYPPGGKFTWPPASLTSLTDAVFMQVEIDPTGGGLSYTSLGSTQLESVPYALYAANGPVGPAGPIGPVGPVGPIGLTGPAGPLGPGIDSLVMGTGFTPGTIYTPGGTINMPNVGTAGTYGSATQVPVITTDAQGRVTTVVNTTIAGDNWGGQVAATDLLTLAGNGTGVNPLRIAQQGATPGQLLAWTGAAWSPITASGTGTVTSIATTLPITGGPITTIGTIGLAPTGTAGTYGDATHIAQITTDAWGRVNTVTAVPIVTSSIAGSPSHLVRFKTTTTGQNSNLIDSSLGLLYNTDAYLVVSTPVTNKLSYHAPTVAGSSNWFSFDGDKNSFSFLTVSDSGFGNRGILMANSVELNNIVSGFPTGSAFGLVYNEGLNQATITNGAGLTVETYDMTAGNVNVIGNLTKGSGTFKIDHPLDPENKYLYHSFVESPDMMNIYNGNVTTDAKGKATVTLPDYFDALNKDFRYQLTVVGGTFAQAIVSKEVSGNSFEIKTNQPNIKVSWQVTGVRQDAYANAHRVVPEVEKEARNKGKYLYPAVYGQPVTKGINYDESSLKNVAKGTQKQK
jgi:hypothetical protein